MDEVNIVEYDPRWQTLFTEEAERIWQALGNDLAKIIEPVVDGIAGAVKTSPVKHLDETGLRIGGKTNWLHVVSTETHTWYRVSPKRKDIEVLAHIKGVVVHDHWNPYYQLQDVNHALCNAHHLP